MIRSWPWAVIFVLTVGFGAEVYPAGSPATLARLPEVGSNAETVSSAAQWSPDHVTLATIAIDTLFATPEGGNSCLYFNSRPIYPGDCKPRPKDTWTHVHTFYTPPEWSPDGAHVALVEKIFDWEYYDPYGRYFDGEATGIRYYLVVVATNRTALGYRLDLGPSYSRYSNSYQEIPAPQLRWLSNSQVSVNGQTFDLAAKPPTPIP